MIARHKPGELINFQLASTVVGVDNAHRYLLYDRDSIFARHLDGLIKPLGLKVLKLPPRLPQANAICEKVIGTIRRECLDWMIRFTEAHLRATLQTWVAPYNGGRPHVTGNHAVLFESASNPGTIRTGPHSSLGPGVPVPLCPEFVNAKPSRFRYRLGEGVAVRSGSVLGGLHHEYYLAPAAA